MPSARLDEPRRTRELVTVRWGQRGSAVADAEL